MSATEPTNPDEQGLFEQLSAAHLRKRASIPHGSDSEYDSEDSLWSSVSDEASAHDISKFEAHNYYAGIRPSGRGPKLIYRTSEDEFVEPTGLEAYRRLMQLVTVPEDHELGKDGRWDIIREMVVEALDKREVQFSSVDFVRFTWLNEKTEEDEEDEENETDSSDEEDEENETDSSDDDNDSYADFAPINPVEDGLRHISNPTIWIGVLKGSLTSAQAHESATDILGILNQQGITNIDVAFRESVAKLSRGPDLFAPLLDDEDLKDVIDDLSTALSLSIVGQQTNIQGTLGFYFKVGAHLYAATVRHVTHNIDDNRKYKYRSSAPKKKVFVLGKRAFANYLALILAKIDSLNSTIDYLVVRAELLAKKEDEASVRRLEKTNEDLAMFRAKVKVHKIFFVEVKTRWDNPKDRVIGYLDWAPPIGFGEPPHGYTKDLSVIRLNKNKFTNFRGNVLSLGPEIPRDAFVAMMNDRVDVPSEFKYPQEGLLPVNDMLTVSDIKNPNSKGLIGDRIRHVIKRGFTTKTTVGTLSGFMSHVRWSVAFGRHHDSIEVAILPHDKASGPFSKGGDSGSLIVDALGRAVALLTGGAGVTDSSDITFGTPMEWVWELIKDEYPGADFYCGDLEA
ncbi:hypothetical protein C8J56DRAFT_155297 [Mycena floridula]|nr:hypothetical protein C8J56DRAFT_155297 [Mycena floridula]